MKPVVIFYTLVFYILFQFAWWAYLLVNLNKEVYQQKIELLKMTNKQEAVDNHILIKKMHERWWMVAGEGTVFLGLLILGIFITNKSIAKEMLLAKQQKNFILSVTHEFKSPLAAIKLNLQTLQKHHFDKEKQMAILNQSIHETDRINALVENALMAARIEGHSYAFSKEEISLAELLKQVIRSKGNFSTTHKIEPHIEEDIFIQGDSLALTSVILNLVENAEKYSPDDGNIKLTLKKSSGMAILSVEDQGIGIPDPEKEKIFEKFYRIGNEDTRKSKGTGLGLFIVKHVVNFHKGKIVVKDNSPKGSIFEVSFPLVNPA